VLVWTSPHDLSPATDGDAKRLVSRRLIEEISFGPYQIGSPATSPFAEARAIAPRT
jgi:hypothetical protein